MYIFYWIYYFENTLMQSIPQDVSIKRTQGFYHTNSGNDRGSLLGSATKIFTGRAAKAIFATPSSLKIRWAGQTCLGQITSGTGVLHKQKSRSTTFLLADILFDNPL